MEELDLEGASTDGGGEGGSERGGVVVVEGVCAGIDRSNMYHTEYCDGRMSLALMVAMLVLGFVTVLVNLGVIIRTIKIVRQGHDKPAFFFIGNLALSDFAIGLYVVIAFLLHITNKSDLWQQKTCMLQIGVAVTACQETIFTIVLISVDKYLYICHGLHYSRMVTRRRVYGALVLSWCLAILVGSLPALGLHVTWEEACNRCVFAQVVSTTFAVIFFITSVAGPLAVVVALYSILLVLAIKMHKARYGGSYTGRASARSSNFRLSFMSKRSLSTTKTSLSSSSSSSSSSSKANRRITRRKDMEEYKKELKRRGAGPGGGGNGGGVGLSSPLSRISEGVELIDKTKNGATSDGADSDIGSRSPGVGSLGKDGNGIWTVPMPSPGTPKAPVCVASTGEGTLNPVAYDMKQKNIGRHPQDSSIPHDETIEDSATDPGVLHAEEVESETLKKQKNTLQKSSIPLNGVEGKTDEETEEDPATGLEEPHEVRFAEERRTERIRKQKNTPQMSPVAFNGGETKVETDEEQTSDLEAPHDLTFPEEQKAGTQKNQSLLQESPGALNGIGTQRETDEVPNSDLEAPHCLKSAEERQAGTQKNQNILQESPGALNGVGTEGETDEVPNSDLEEPHKQGMKKLKMPGKTAKLPGISNGSRTDEEVPSSPEAPHGTSDTEGTTTDEGEGEGKDKGEGGWRAMFPSKYMNRVMVETRDKMLFLKKCRALKTVLLILISFTATYVPFVVGTLVYSAQKEKRPCLLHLLNTLLYIAVVANSLANPLIYAYGYREFRVKSEKFKGVFAREKPRNIS